jgi:hypothetical protein
LPAFGAPTNATCAAPSRRTEIDSRWMTFVFVRERSISFVTHLRMSA